VGKRGNGEGTIYKCKDREGYRAAYWAQTPDGRKRKYVSGKTRAEVARKLRSATANRDEGLVFDSKNQTVGQYLDQWLSDAVMGSVKQRTYDNYEYIVRKHLKPILGHRKLRDLAPDHVQSLYRAKQD